MAQAGNNAVSFLRMAVMLVAGSIAGLLYVLLLPIAWTVAAVVIIAKRIVEGLFTLSARTGTFGWRPIEAYLAGRRDRKHRSKAGKPKAQQ